MILIIIFVFMLLLGFVLMHISSNKFEDLEILGMFLTIFGSLFLIISITVIIVSYTCTDYAIKENKIEYEGLCKRYEIIKSEYEDVSKSDMIGDITEWNMKVYSTKHWTESPWTNWFNPKDIADNMDYIPLE